MRKTVLSRLNRRWLRYEYKHTTLAILILVVFIVLFDSALLGGVYKWLAGLEYLGGFIGGVLSASFFTAASAVVLIVTLSTQLDPLLLAMIVGLGSAVGDLILMLFFEEKVGRELAPLFKRLRKKKLLPKAGKPSFTLLLTGMLFIVTPFPDEIGLSVLGISHFPKTIIFVICLGLNTLGAGLLILATRALV